MGSSSPTSLEGAARYELHGDIASGGMATVHLGRSLEPGGASRTVAIKRLHPHFAKEPEFVAMFLDEARLATRVKHPNVVSTLDAVSREGDLLLVMELIEGEALSKLMKTARAREEPIPPRIVAAILAGALHGLHAAHEATDGAGAPLGLVHRDVSPQNLIVGRDGKARVLDFGIAKAAGRLHQTQEGRVKGKLPYMAPEQLRGALLTRQTDIYAASVVLWECLTGQWLFDGPSEAAIIAKVYEGAVEAPSARAPGVPPELDAIALKALEREPARRFASAHAMAVAIEQCIVVASPAEVGAWVEQNAGPELALRRAQIAEMDAGVARTLDRRRSRRTRLALAMAGCCAIAALAVTFGSSASRGRLAAAAPRTATATSAPSVVDTARASATLALPVASADSDIDLDLVPVPDPKSPRPGTRGGARSKASGSAAHSAKKSGRDCTVPYVIDAHGIQRYIPECVESR